MNDPKQQRCQWQMTAESKQIKKMCIEWVTWNYGSLTVSINTNRGKVAGRQIYSYTHANLDRCQAQFCLYNAGNWPDTETFLTHQGGGAVSQPTLLAAASLKFEGFWGEKNKIKMPPHLAPAFWPAQHLPGQEQAAGWPEEQFGGSCPRFLVSLHNKMPSTKPNRSLWSLLIQVHRTNFAHLTHFLCSCASSAVFKLWALETFKSHLLSEDFTSATECLTI